MTDVFSTAYGAVFHVTVLSLQSSPPVNALMADGVASPTLYPAFPKKLRVTRAETICLPAGTRPAVPGGPKSIETVTCAQWYDANISIPGCDKNMPGCIMAMKAARLALASQVTLRSVS